jgi:hypothetical protein
MWGQLQINETGAEHGIRSYEKGVRMGAKINAKSIRNRVRDADAFWDCFQKPNAPKARGHRVPVLEPFSLQSRKNSIQKGINKSM